MDLRAQILGSDDLKQKPLFIREWNATVYIRTLTGTQRDEFEAGLVKGKGANVETNIRGMRARLAIACCVDKDGQPIFKPSDEQALGEKSARALGRIFDVASELNGLSKSDVDELVGNSEPAPSGDSTFDSPLPLAKQSASSSAKSAPAS